MIPLPPDLIRAVASQPMRKTLRPMYVAMGRDPWRITATAQIRHHGIASEDVIFAIFERHFTPEIFAIAEYLPAILMHSCKMQRNRARALLRCALHWNTTAYVDVRELPGMCKSVTDTVSLYCFGHLDEYANDSLKTFSATYTGPRLDFADGYWHVRWQNANRSMQNANDASLYFNRLYEAWQQHGST